MENFANVDWIGPVFGLVGVVLGWVLSVATESIATRRKMKRYYKALYLELQDAHSKILTRAQAAEQALQTFCDSGSLQSGPIVVTQPIFDAHFADAAYLMTEDERLGFTSIYETMRWFNKRVTDLHDALDVSGVRSHERSDRARVVTATLLTLYGGARELSALMTPLLIHRKSFEMRGQRNIESIAAESARIHIAVEDWARRLEISLNSSPTA